MARPKNRPVNSLREVTLTRNFTHHAEGSVLACFGDTKVICTASVENKVPHFVRGSGRGWVTAEYSMLPRSTNTRSGREAARGKQSGRTQEIQRLIGRSLRAAVDFEALGERTITLDCDVIQADGGTRTAAITGAWVALHDAMKWIEKNCKTEKSALAAQVASVSVGVVDSEVLLDLEYVEDVRAETDMNVVMDANGGFIEVQGTAEQQAFSRQEMDRMLEYAESGIADLFKAQAAAIAE